MRKFSRTRFSIFELSSMKVALAAPRLKASMPTLPVPAKRSKKRTSSTRKERILKRACFTRSIMGRVPGVFGPLSLRPLASPVTTRILLLLDESQHHFRLTYNIVSRLRPRNERHYLVVFQFLELRYSPRTLYQLQELLIADLVIYHI